MELRQRLRTETATAHQDLETLLDIMSPSLDADRYVNILHVFSRLHSGLEARVAEISTARPDSFAHEYLATRRKSSWLEADLGAGAAGSPPVNFDWIVTEPQLLGALYVIEGSTLGGQVVSKHLRGLPGVTRTSYFESYGADTGRNWQKFSALLGLRDISEHDEIVASADRMFVTIATAFRG